MKIAAASGERSDASSSYVTLPVDTRAWPRDLAQRGVLRSCRLACAVTSVMVGALACDTPGNHAESTISRSTAALLSDGAHGGTRGFYFLAPVTEQPAHSGVFEPRLAPEVRIDRVNEQGVVRRNIGTFKGRSVQRNLRDEYYVTRWHSSGGMNPTDLYRARVLVDKRELGSFDIDLVASEADRDAVDHAVAVPLLRGDTLTIAFRIEKEAVDRDGDGVFDGVDNCPDVPNPAKSFNPPEVPPESPRQPSDCASERPLCTAFEQPTNLARFVQLDTDRDRIGDACDCAGRTAGSGGVAISCGNAGSGGRTGGAEPAPEAGSGGYAGSVSGRGGHDPHREGHGGHGGHGAGGMSGGMGAHAGTDGTHGGTGGHPHVGSGPFVDISAIPEGDPGVGTVRIRRTDEKPEASDIGAFRTVCTFSHMNFDDPIVFPGKRGAAHLHTYFGNTLANAASTAASLRATGNSTCRGGIANRSAYWVPALLDADGVPQKPDPANLYYKTGYNGIEPSRIKPFPAGLRMIAGDAKASAAQEHAYWHCDEDSARSATIPTDCDRDDQLVMTVVFPQCWDGKNLDSPDHKSHMAYPEDGACPKTHPVPVPEITFNIPYPVPRRGTRGFHLASDTYDPSLPGGYSAHGDWFDAWDPAVMQAWVKHCDRASVDCHSHLLGDGRMQFYRDPTLDAATDPAADEE